MRALALAGLLLVGLAVPAAAQEPPLRDVVPGTQVVVVGVPGLRWDDVDRFRTPTLHRLAGESATGVLSVKARPATSCPADGWLTLGAGSRADAFGACRPGDVEDRDDVRARNLATRDEADVDALATALREGGACLAALGPGAELAGGDPARQCPVLLVDGPTVGGPDRAEAAATADALVADVESVLSPSATLLVVGLSGTAADEAAHLHVALGHGPDLPAGPLRSASTRRTPYVQLVDVAPTVLDLLGIEVPTAMTGQPWQAADGGRTVEELADLDRRAVAARAAWVPFFVVLVGALLAACAAAAAWRSWRVAEVAGLAGVIALTVSYLAGLVPWWRAPAATALLLGGVAVLAVGGAFLVRLAPGVVRPARLATAALAAVLAVDLLAGGALQMDAPAGYSPLVAGRFAGIGNVAFGVFATSVLLALAAATAGPPSRRAAAMVAGVGAVAVVLDGAPPFGSDVGGVLALVPAVALLALLRGGHRVRPWTLAAAGLAGAVVVTAFAVADWSRDPSDRTHLGRFVEQVRDGSAGTVLRRKAEAVGALLFANPATALLPLVAAAAVWLVARPPAPLREAFDAVPAWRHGLLAVGLVSAIGFVINDSGPAVPAFALLVAVPATLAVCARVSACRRRAVADDG